VIPFQRALQAQLPRAEAQVEELAPQVEPPVSREREQARWLLHRWLWRRKKLVSPVWLWSLRKPALVEAMRTFPPEELPPECAAPDVDQRAWMPQAKESQHPN